jgi:HK97 family phage portal protein
MKLKFKDRLKILVTGSFDEYTKAFFSGEDLPPDGPVDAEMALKYSVVFACNRVLSETYASVPKILYKKQGKDRIPVTELGTSETTPQVMILYDIMHTTPNEEMSAFNFKEAQMSALNLGGNSVSEKLVNSRGEIVGLYPYSYDRVKIERDRETQKLKYIIDGNKKTLDRSQVLHIPGPSLDGVIGMSPISYAASAIRLGLQYEKFGVKFYENAANPGGAIECPDQLSPDAAERLKKDLRDNHQGLKNTGVPLLLEGGLKWQQITINPVDAQLIESKYFQIEDICRIYRVPQHLVNKLDRSTNNNIEHQSLEFVMYTMLPWFKRHEECDNAQLIPRELRIQGYFFESKMDGLLRGDSAARAALYANGRQWGWLSANDIRKLENLPSLGPEGDIFLSPANMIEAGTDAQNAVNAKVLDEIYALIEERRTA